MPHPKSARRVGSSRISAAAIAVFVGVVVAATAGCEPDPPKKAKVPITQRKTQDIRDSAKEQAAGAQARPVGTAAPNTTNLGSLPGTAYTTGISVAAAAQVKSGIDAYFAENGEYPKTHEAFMDEVVKKYQLRLPALPRNQQYAYNSQTHQLEILVYPHNSDPNAQQQPNANPAPNPNAGAPANSGQSQLPGALKNLPLGS